MIRINFSPGELIKSVFCIQTLPGSSNAGRFLFPPNFIHKNPGGIAGIFEPVGALADIFCKNLNIPDSLIFNFNSEIFNDTSVYMFINIISHLPYFGEIYASSSAVWDTRLNDVVGQVLSRTKGQEDF